MTERHSPEMQDAFSRSFADIPLDHELRAMAYVDLCGLLGSCQSGSQKFLVVEAEKKRRDALPEVGKHPLQEQKAKPAPDHWYKKPVPVIGLAVASGLILLGVRYALNRFWGLQL